MNTAQVVETSVTVNNNSPIQDYIHLDDHAQPTYEMTPGFKLLFEGYMYKQENNSVHVMKQANVRNSMWRVGCHELAWENYLEWI